MSTIFNSDGFAIGKALDEVKEFQKRDRQKRKAGRLPRFRAKHNCDAPDGFTNGERAEKAAEVLVHFAVAPYEPETDLQDLLSDLMHYAHREGLDFEEILGSATRRYEEEA